VWKEVVVTREISALYEMVPGFLAASVAIVVVSKLGRAPSDAVQFTHKGVQETLKVHGY
jgi:sodium/proline symporter